MNILISVIVPIYNVEKYVEKCIQSIINQTYSNIQIVLVDDGSTDSSGVICDLYKDLDKRIIVLHQENGGLVAARKAGLKLAIGDYVGFVDGDDYIEPAMYENLLQNILATDADIVHSGFFKNDSKKVWGTRTESVYNLRTDNTYEIVRDLIFSDNMNATISSSIWSKLFKKSVVVRAYNSVPDFQSYGEDLICLCHSLLICRKISIMNASFYHYVLRNDSIVHEIKKDCITREYSLYEQLIAVFKKTPIYGEVRSDIEALLMRNLSFALKKVAPSAIRCYEYPQMEDLIDKKVAIYGAGLVGQDYYSQLRLHKQCDVVAWVDKAFDSCLFNYCKVSSIESLKDIEYDVVVVAVSNESTAFEIMTTLMQMGIEKQKVVWKPPVYAVDVRR